jgi:hypothetical protein
MIYVFSEHKDNSAFGRMAPPNPPHDDERWRDVPRCHRWVEDPFAA